MNGLFYFQIMWKWLEKYFTFTQGQRGGIIILIIFSACTFIIPSVYFYFKPVEHIGTSNYEKEVTAFIHEYDERKQLALADTLADSISENFNPYSNIDFGSQFKNKEKRAIEYFNFDPNKIGVAEWIKLGFSQKQAESIEKSKAKGYKFYKPEDLKNMYVVGEENYNRLSAYIKIEPNDFPKKEYSKTIYPERKKEKYVIDINTADSSLFEQQKGIGPTLASRIIKYRNRLGGFVSAEQIKEVWNFPDSTYQSLKEQFVVNSISVNKININTADFKTLGTHPYINYTYAKVIEAYRKQHGNFKAISDLKKTVVIRDSIFLKMEPYITIE